MAIFDNQYILSNIVNWLNEATVALIHRNYIYINDDISKRYEDKSKSYLIGQFYTDYTNNLILLRILLDPNVAWHNPSANTTVYNAIVDHVTKSCVSSFGTLCQLKVEFLFDQKSLLESHEVHSHCRSEETDRCLCDDTFTVWRSAISNKLMFIRSSSILLADKKRVFENTGKKDFSDYRAEVKAINSRYNFKEDNNSILDAFEEYKVIYRNYFGKELFTINDEDITTFCLMDWTDYSIKERKIDWDQYFNQYNPLPKQGIPWDPFAEVQEK